MHMLRVQVFCGALCVAEEGMSTAQHAAPEMVARGRGATTNRDDKKRFSPREVGRSVFIPPGGQFPKDAGDIVLEDREGRAMCWRMGHQTAEEFIAGRAGFRLKGAFDILFHTGRIKVFFPISAGKPAPYNATKSVTIKAQATLARVLVAVENCVHHAMAAHLVKDLGRPSVTLGEVRHALEHVVVCHLVCTRAGGWNHVYVRM